MVCTFISKKLNTNVNHAYNDEYRRILTLEIVINNEELNVAYIYFYMPNDLKHRCKIILKLEQMATGK